MKLKRGLVVTAALALTVTLGTLVEGRRSGASSGFNGSIASSGLTCMECHTPGFGGSGSVQILGAPDLYQAGQSYDIAVRIADNTQFGAGFQLSVEDADGQQAGELQLIDTSKTKYSGSSHNWVTHTSSGVDDSVATWADNGNSYDYMVRWVAPAENMGTVTFYAAGNAINDNFLTTGDFIYLAQESAVMGGVDCGAINAVVAKCKDGTFKVVGIAKTSLAEGTVLTLSLDGGNDKSVTINRRGKGKTNWRDVSAGGHTVCVVECPGECGSTSCNP